MYTETPIFRKMYAFTILIHKALHNMSRDYRYTLGAEIVQICWNCLDLIMCASTSSGQKKKDEILKLSIEFNRFSIRLRAMQELKIISAGQYTHWQEIYLLEIGKQIGGWVKWAK